MIAAAPEANAALAVHSQFLIVELMPIPVGTGADELIASSSPRVIGSPGTAGRLLGRKRMRRAVGRSARFDPSRGSKIHPDSRMARANVEVCSADTYADIMAHVEVVCGRPPPPCSTVDSSPSATALGAGSAHPACISARKIRILTAPIPFVGSV